MCWFSTWHTQTRQVTATWIARTLTNWVTSASATKTLMSRGADSTASGFPLRRRLRLQSDSYSPDRGDDCLLYVRVRFVSSSGQRGIRVISAQCWYRAVRVRACVCAIVCDALSATVIVFVCCGACNTGYRPRPSLIYQSMILILYTKSAICKYCMMHMMRHLK